MEPAHHVGIDITLSKEIEGFANDLDFNEKYSVSISVT